MTFLGRVSLLALLALMSALMLAPATFAQDQPCDPDFEDCGQTLPGDEEGDGGDGEDVDLEDLAGDLDGGEPEAEPVAPPVIRDAPATVPGKVAQLRRNGKAAIPRRAPKRVRAILAAANRIVGKPYKWGGGHAKLFDRGYDCSGTVSFALIRSGFLASPLNSGGFARWGRRGKGRWVTIYANKGHVYMEVAGLRLDTSQVADPGGRKGVRFRPAIGKRKGFKVRRIAGL